MKEIYESATTLSVMRVREVENNDLSWFFVVYKDGPEYLGSAVIEAHGPADAAMNLSEAGVDPGRGSLTMMPLAPELLPPENFRGKLLTEVQVKELWPQVRETKEGA